VEVCLGRADERDVPSIAELLAVRIPKATFAEEDCNADEIPRSCQSRNLLERLIKRITHYPQM
jgi:hypothetical protein